VVKAQIPASKELSLSGLTYVIGVTVTYFIAKRFDTDAVGVSQVAGTLLGVWVANWLYQSRNEQVAPAKVKAVVGGTLAVLCVLQGLVFQQLLKWMTYPDISIGLGALGAVVFPFLLWNTFGKAVRASRKR
jgi:hypothetical protein